MKVTYITHSGDDLLVVNAARVSMKKKSELVPVCINFIVGRECEDFPCKSCNHVLSEKDKKLIEYLAKHNHWTPFGHPHITLHVKVPIFVARQLMRSNVGIVYNEVSRRYVDDKPEFWWPRGDWRKRAENVKQGSSDETVEEVYFSNIGEALDITDVATTAVDECVEVYEELLKADIAPELARIVLPQNMYTEFYMTGSLAAFARVCKLRLDPHAQKEIRDVASQISDTIEPMFPVSWKALMEN